MSRPPTIPEALVAAPFRGSAAVLDGVLTRAQLRSRAWRRLFRDVYVADGLELETEIRMAALRLLVDPGTVVCGLTAAWLQGAWEPPPGQPVPLEVTRPVRAPGSLLRGVGRRRLTLRGTPDLLRPAFGLSALDEDVVDVDGLAVTSPTRTCFDLVRQRHLVEAVAIADAFAYRCGLSLPILDAYCSDRRRWPHVRHARIVTELAVHGARSPGESRLRMIIVLAGLDQPLVNVPVYRDGVHIATPDLMLREPWLAIEYDGGYHDEGLQPSTDRVRANAVKTELSFPALHFDRDAVRDRRPLILEQVCRLSRRRPTQELEDRDFFRGLRN